MSKKEEFNMHELGNLTVNYGSIYPKDGSFMINNICLVVDKSDGIVFKYGDKDTSDIISYFEHTVKVYREKGHNDMADNLMLLEFNRYDGVLDIDEICTLVNWFRNSIGHLLMETLQLSEIDLKAKIKSLQEMGW
jgi:hypothetical protein